MSFHACACVCLREVWYLEGHRDLVARLTCYDNYRVTRWVIGVLNQLSKSP